MRWSTEHLPLAHGVRLAQHIAYAVTALTAFAAASLGADAMVALAVGAAAGLSLSGSV